MDEYTPNSYKYKEQQKEAEANKKVTKKVVTGTVKTRKPSEFKKLTGNIFSGEASTVKEYIVSDVIIPAIKDILHDVFTKSVDMFLYGSSSDSRKSKNGYGVSYRNYNDYSNRSSRNTQVRHSYNYNEIILDSSREAETVLSQMEDIIEQYNVVSVGDLYDLVGITGSYTDNRYGWTDLRSAQVVRISGGGYLLKLPRALPID